MINKKLFILSFIFLFQLTSFSQEMIVHYDYTPFSNSGKVFNTTLKIKEGKCWYSNHMDAQQFENAEGYRYKFNKIYKDWFYDDSKKSIIQTLDREGLPPLYSTWKADMKWKITGETKKIGKYQVQKATTKPLYDSSSPFNIAHAVAWFTTDVPVNCGPDGYYGLPGLIVALEFEGYIANEKELSVFGINTSQLNKIEYENIDDWDIPNADARIDLSGQAEGHYQYINNVKKIKKNWLKQQKKLLNQKRR